MQVAECPWTVRRLVEVDGRSTELGGAVVESCRMEIREETTSRVSLRRRVARHLELHRGRRDRRRVEARS